MPAYIVTTSETVTRTYTFTTDETPDTPAFADAFYQSEAYSDGGELVEVESVEILSTAPTFPEETVPVTVRGFRRTGKLTDQRDQDNEAALYYFPGNFAAGDPFELWLTRETASDESLLDEYVNGEED